jgi:hypothetical protein
MIRKSDDVLREFWIPKSGLSRCQYIAPERTFPSKQNTTFPNVVRWFSRLTSLGCEFANRLSVRIVILAVLLRHRATPLEANIKHEVTKRRCRLRPQFLEIVCQGVGGSRIWRTLAAFGAEPHFALFLGHTTRCKTRRVEWKHLLESHAPLTMLLFMSGQRRGKELPAFKQLARAGLINRSAIADHVLDFA